MITRTLPASMLDASGRASFAAIIAICNEAERRGLQHVPIAERPARIGPVDALWLDASGSLHLILTGRELRLVMRD